VAYPETELHLNGLALALLREVAALTPDEREFIAGWVAALHDGSIGGNIQTGQGPISGKLQALLVIAGKAQQGWCCVTLEDVAQARAAGADDLAIHDTVLIAAAFSLFRRYVDGLTAAAPRPAAGCAETIPDLASVPDPGRPQKTQA
jgi:hypothetical protein